MNIVTWSRNPSRKDELGDLLSGGTLWEETTPFWRAGVATWQEQTTLVIVWDGQIHAGALQADALQALRQFVEGHLNGAIPKILLAVTSAGADIHQPFESLVALNHWMEMLLTVKAQHHIDIEGIILPPMGTYGGASIMMSTVCDTLWCDSPEDIHLLGSH